MTTYVQSNLDGFVETGEFRRPLPGEFWRNGECVVCTDILPSDNVGHRRILVPVEMSLSRESETKDDFIYEYDT